MSDRDKLEALTNGVFAFLADREISTQESIADGAKAGVIQWMDANREAIVEAIAKRVADRIKV